MRADGTPRARARLAAVGGIRRPERHDDQRPEQLAVQRGSAGTSEHGRDDQAPPPPSLPIKTIRTGVLEIGYHESGDPSGVPVILLHGFPDDAYAYDGVLPLLAKAGLRAHPVRAVLVFFKDENRLHLYAGKRGGMKFVKSYPVLAASGRAGPKLREGDEQVPEGIYGVEGLNPNSKFHVSLRVGYPNAFDRAKARRDGRASSGTRFGRA